MDTIATISPVGQVSWKLDKFLAAEGLSAYKLAKSVKRGRENTIYRIAREGNEVKRVDFEVLADTLDGLRQLTGRDIQLSDILEYSPDN